MPKPIDQKRSEAAARRLEDVDIYKMRAERDAARGIPESVNYWKRKAECAERDAANTLAKVRSRPATFMPWYERSDPIVPGQQ